VQPGIVQHRNNVGGGRLYWALWISVIWLLITGILADASSGGKRSKSITLAVKAVLIIIALCGLAELTAL
jgi:cytochrome b subunit of formate dehydrogenase